MSYRPQFAFPRARCYEQTCMYSFDATNLPAFTKTLIAGAQSGRIPLKLDKDADFILRAIDCQGAISIRLEDPWGNSLSDCDHQIQARNFELQTEYCNTYGAGFVALEGGLWGLPLPASSNLALYIYNQTASTITLSTCAVNLIGVKQYPDEVCR